VICDNLARKYIKILYFVDRIRPEKSGAQELRRYSYSSVVDCTVNRSEERLSNLGLESSMHVTYKIHDRKRLWP
jgi:hypothetical protein